MSQSTQSDKTDVKINWWSLSGKWGERKMHKNLNSLSSANSSVQSSYHLVSSIYPHWSSEGKSLCYCSRDIPFISSSEKVVIVQVTIFLTGDQLSCKNNTILKYIRVQKMLPIIVSPRNFSSWTIQSLFFTYSNKYIFKASMFASVYVQIYLFLHIFLN